jgi:hypothetical protein
LCIQRELFDMSKGRRPAPPPSALLARGAELRRERGGGLFICPTFLYLARPAAPRALVCVCVCVVGGWRGEGWGTRGVPASRSPAPAARPPSTRPPTTTNDAGLQVGPFYLPRAPVPARALSFHGRPRQLLAGVAFLFASWPGTPARGRPPPFPGRRPSNRAGGAPAACTKSCRRRRGQCAPCFRGRPGRASGGGAWCTPQGGPAPPRRPPPILPRGTPNFAGAAYVRPTDRSRRREGQCAPWFGGRPRGASGWGAWCTPQGCPAPRGRPPPKLPRRPSNFAGTAYATCTNRSMCQEGQCAPWFWGRPWRVPGEGPWRRPKGCPAHPGRPPSKLPRRSPNFAGAVPVAPSHFPDPRGRRRTRCWGGRRRRGGQAGPPWRCIFRPVPHPQKRG